MSQTVAKSKKPSDKEAALAAYNRVVEKAELLDIRLTDFKYSVKPKYYPAIEQESEGNINLSRTFDHDVVDINHDTEIGALGGRFVWSLKISQGKTRLLNVDASFFVVYKDVPDVGHEHVEAYLRRVGRFATYPYFRSLVAQMSWESSAELPVMPILK
ncbi:hypothetical protein [Shinella sp. HZN7]|uniref:hypothetical protein n=1 Tax=Shinella sp. (strain HZN7) TaxID=879274 RepID=UPI0007DAA524|nr:hypothetical protein [Shinella sp. HZN7]ANH06256.1 hypothetical protein shn_20905 [Shinella sp. HZN7]